MSNGFSGGGGSRRSRGSHQPAEKLPAGESRKQLAFLLQFYRPYAMQAIIALGIMLITASMGLLFPAFVGKMLDGFLHPDRQNLPFGISASPGMLALALLGLIAVQSIIRFGAATTMAAITEKAIAELRTRTYEHIIRLPMSFFGEKRVGELSSRMSSDLTQIQETFAFTMLELIRQSIFLTGGIAFILSASLNLAIPVLLAMPVLVIIAVFFGRLIKKQSTATQDALAESATVLEETLQAITSVKSYVNESFEARRYHSTLSKTILLAIKTARYRSAFVSFILFAFFGGIAGVIWYGGSLMQRGQITMGDFATFLMYAMFVGGAMGSFAELLGQVQKALGSSVRIQQILSEKTEDMQINPDKISLRSVELAGISFSYPSRPDIQALKNISLQIQAGQRIAFVGESGAGKSTAAALIQQFYQPTEGTIFYNSIPASQLGIHSIRSDIAVVPQDIVLFGGTIAQNIAYGDLQADKDQIYQAAASANALEFIERFPEGFDTVVGERGIQLSGGQRQRIAIARAILKNPPILILDEATSSLDSASEYLIQEALERLMANRTTIIIAHRLSTIRNCDGIAVFSKGQIVEFGRHEELLQKGGLYARLAELQFGQNMQG
jgi:ABC-type multidrug transport system fused ATPase/permease subunit